VAAYVTTLGIPGLRLAIKQTNEIIRKTPGCVRPWVLIMIRIEFNHTPQAQAATSSLPVEPLSVVQ